MTIFGIQIRNPFRASKPRIYMSHSERLHFVGRVRNMRDQKVRRTMRSIKPDHTNLATK